MGQSTILSVFQKAEEEIQSFQNPRTQTNLQKKLNYAVETRVFLLVQARALNCQTRTNLQTSRKYVIEARKFLFQAREALEVARGSTTIDQIPLDYVLRQLQEQIERVHNPLTKTKLQRKLNYAAQEARGGTDTYWSQLQMVQEEMAILLLNSVKH